MVAQVEVVGEVGVREVLEQQGEVLLAIPGVQVREEPQVAGTLRYSTWPYPARCPLPPTPTH